LKISFAKFSTEVELAVTDGANGKKKKTFVLHRSKFCEQMGLLGQK
jgi:hypothetical protein